ncbi:hypothetical protein IX321_000906 [Bacteroides pyogenes]|nr:hypothetical protein [Bacteroides pyogenes]MBR8718469.1 hypothetical protein [Bacteroides pyogenes]MBR8746493.1 hypothetical protein [Bacteroides pyogenes]MBR8756765.1 hypothetical protein [Bacteroides pyogenes]MBR8780053.1 hypothetical protein [Bacteroides pyogenes]
MEALIDLFRGFVRLRKRFCFTPAEPLFHLLREGMSKQK